MANERRLIDKNALLEKLSRMIDYCESNQKVNGLTALFQVGDAIMDCPTVDAVEVVRCKECRYFLPKDSGELNKCGNLRGMFAVRPDSYCSYGEKSGTQPQREDVI